MNDHRTGCGPCKLRLTRRGERVAALIPLLVLALATLAPTLERLAA
jgi:hypothetical protein